MAKRTGRGKAKAAAPEAQATEAASAAPVAAAPKVEKVVETPEQILARLQSAKETKERWAPVTRIIEMGKSGPIRVEIQCTDPQTIKGENICVGTREIAVQDLFQVRRCAPCQKRVTRAARRERQKAKDKALRAAVKANKAA